jgi:hypothetical protein
MLYPAFAATRNGFNTSSDIRAKPCEAAVSALDQRSVKRHALFLSVKYRRTAVRWTLRRCAICRAATAVVLAVVEKR